MPVTESFGLLVILGIWIAASVPPEATTAEAAEEKAAVVRLPAPARKGTMTVEEALRARRSIRRFADKPLTLAELGQLLWAGQGITGPPDLRTAPSAGALYPLEIYVITQKEVSHYNPVKHELIVQQDIGSRDALFAAALEQESVQNAPVVIVIAAVYARTMQKYGPGRAPRYVHMEAGHAAQNILLQAAGLELAAVPVGAFHDEQVKKVLSLPEDHQPLYLIPVGHVK